MRIGFVLRKPKASEWLFTLTFWVWSQGVLAQDRMELHLVLAFDVSASVNDVEFDLQRSGTAAAFRAPLVAAAVKNAPGGVAVAIIQWSSVTRQALGLDWEVLKTGENVADYADLVDAMPRRLPGGGTMIHSGLEFAGRLLEAAPGYARRHVIDLSGNGRSDDLERMLEARDRLVSNGVVINALAIEELNNDLTSYFNRHLIGGPNAFVITADEFENFADAMQVKLLREISGAVFSGLQPRQGDQRYDAPDALTSLERLPHAPRLGPFRRPALYHSQQLAACRCAGRK